MNKNDKLLNVVLAITFLGIIILGIIMFVYKDKLTQPKDENNKQTVETIKIPALKKSVNIPFEPLSYLSGMTKEEVYQHRIKYVQKSIFADPNYKPSDDVLGGIEDGKPWIDIDCTVAMLSDVCSTSGLSEETRFMNNPAILIGNVGSYYRCYTKECQKSFDKNQYKQIPDKITYFPDEKRIETTYYVVDKEDIFAAGKMLVGFNAKDLGYKYGYANYLKNVNFPSENSIAKRVYEFCDFWHLGGACRVEGGCNNGSPYQKDTVYNIKNLPARIDFKLWKEEPQDKHQDADFNFSIIFIDKSK